MNSENIRDIKKGDIWHKHEKAEINEGGILDVQLAEQKQWQSRHIWEHRG